MIIIKIKFFRVLLFQAWFDDLWERYETYSSGESLFGIEITEYPALQQRKRELNLLQKLYSLYLQVMRSVDGYYEIPWAEIDTDAIIAELTDFQNKFVLHDKKYNVWQNLLQLCHFKHNFIYLDAGDCPEH